MSDDGRGAPNGSRTRVSALGGRRSAVDLSAHVPVIERPGTPVPGRLCIVSVNIPARELHNNTLLFFIKNSLAEMYQSGPLTHRTTSIKNLSVCSGPPRAGKYQVLKKNPTVTAGLLYWGLRVSRWWAFRGSNPDATVYETAALPIELKAPGAVCPACQA